MIFILSYETQHSQFEITVIKDKRFRFIDTNLNNEVFYVCIYMSVWH